MRDRTTPFRRRCPGGLIVLLLAVGAWPAASTDSPPAFTLPIACDPGTTCWIVNYVDHDPGPGTRDYACGQATYNGAGGKGHNGTDFAIRDGRAMRDGVAVLAAADGVVTATRDGEADADILAGTTPVSGGKECGNGVVIDHGNGWETQYCHLRRASVAAVPRQRVRRGERLGLVGLSGFTQFPHLHITFRHAGKTIDPFVGAVRSSECGIGDAPLWQPATLAKLPYALNVVYHAGFAGEKPSAGKARNGEYAESVLDRGAAALVLWADLFNVRAGHRLVLSIRGPNGQTVGTSAIPLERNQARVFKYAGKAQKGGRWPAGDYEGRVHLEGPDGSPVDGSAPTIVRVTVR